MRKKITLWLSALLLSLTVLSGCTEEDVQLVGDLLEVLLETSETTAPAQSQGNPAEDDTDYGAITDFGILSDFNRDTQTAESIFGESLSEEESAVSLQEPESRIFEDGTYTTAEDVAFYIAAYGHLPSNYITKKEAQALGWDSSAGNLWDVAPGMCIGGDRFGNYEGLLPEKEGRKYTECDVNYEGGYRRAERIIFSNDGLVYYTEDHYETFTLLYGEE